MTLWKWLAGDRKPVSKPFWLVRWWLEQRAARIADPVERLRFLRRAGGRAGIQWRLWQHAAALLLAGLLLLLIPISSITRATGLMHDPVTPPARPVLRIETPPMPKVWLVDRKEDYETYSNGLRIETRGAQTLSGRQFRPIDRIAMEKAGKEPAIWTQERDQPVGIVFHTTESDWAPFTEDHNRQLNRMAQGTLSYVREKKAYHYLVDRFGRVSRVVREDSPANHAGWSVWGDERYVYVNLNSSFLAVAFEGQTRPKDGGTISAAQLHAGRILTDMLRSKYQIEAADCVTHAQVSLNPDNFRIGAHTDWGTGFPWEQMGLADNYEIPPASMTMFGFSYDSTYLSVSESRLWRGLILAQERVREAAAARQKTEAQYRQLLQRRFQAVIRAMETP